MVIFHLILQTLLGFYATLFSLLKTDTLVGFSSPLLFSLLQKFNFIYLVKQSDLNALCAELINTVITYEVENFGRHGKVGLLYYTQKNKYQ